MPLGRRREAAAGRQGREWHRPEPKPRAYAPVTRRRLRYGDLPEEGRGPEDQLPVVIKSLEEHFFHIPGIAGATILGDGSVCFILDVAAILN